MNLVNLDMAVDLGRCVLDPESAPGLGLGLLRTESARVAMKHKYNI